MLKAITAGSLYFVGVFVIAFALGALRVLVVAPRLGAMAAVLIEVPILLAVSWRACDWLVRRCGVAGRWPDRLVMGGVAFALLMIAEYRLSIVLFGRASAEYWASFQSAAALVGLGGQILFALVPLLSPGRSARA